jgi:hypothetical protein
MTSPESLLACGTAELYCPPRGKRYGRLFVKTDADAHTAPRLEYVVKGIMNRAELGVIFGEPGTAKSFLIMYIARRTGQDRKVFGRRVRPTRTLFCALEGEGGFEKRLRAEIAERGPCDLFAYITQPINLFSDAQAQADLKAAIKDHRADMVVIDTLARAFGEGSENDSGDMGKLISVVDSIRAETGALVVLIHHSGKDISRGMRGHTALLGAADVVLEVTRPAGGNFRSVRIVKAKDDVDGSRFAFELKVVDLGQDEEGEAITSCVVVETEMQAPIPRRQRLTPELQAAFRELGDLFSTPGATALVRPKLDMSATPCVTKSQTKDHWIKTGRVDRETLKPDAVNKQVQRLRNRLSDIGKIGMTDKYVWLLDEVDTGGQ